MRRRKRITFSPNTHCVELGVHGNTGLKYRNCLGSNGNRVPVYHLVTLRSRRLTPSLVARVDSREPTGVLPWTSASIHNPLDFIKGDGVVTPVVKPGRPTRLMPSHRLRHLKLPAVLQVRRNACGTKAVT